VRNNLKVPELIGAELFCRNGDEDGDEDALSAITCGGVKRWIYCPNS